MPNDDRIKSLSYPQAFWLAQRIENRRIEDKNFMFDLAKMICSFINPTGAKEFFLDKSSKNEEFISFGGDKDKFISDIKDKFGVDISDSKDFI